MAVPTTLWEYYTGDGGQLPSIGERAILFEQYGLGSASNYTGTAEQNTALLQSLLEDPSPGGSITDPLEYLAPYQSTFESVTVGDILAALSDGLNLFPAELAEALAPYGLTLGDVNDAMAYFSKFPPSATMWDVLVGSLGNYEVPEIPTQVFEQLPVVQLDQQPSASETGFALTENDTAYQSQSFSLDEETGSWSAGEIIVEATKETVFGIIEEGLMEKYEEIGVKVLTRYGLGLPFSAALLVVTVAESFDDTIGHGIDYAMQRFYYGVEEPLIDRDQVMRDFVLEASRFLVEESFGAVDQGLAEEYVTEWLSNVGFAIIETQSIAGTVFVNDAEDADGVNMWGGAQRDVLFGSFGNDNLGGLGGHDVLYGAQGADRLYGAAGNDTLDGGDGDDTLDGGFGIDSLVGGAGDDSLHGGIMDFDDNSLDGGDGNDTLTGGEGNDYLAGGAGADTLNGSTGQDTAVYGGLYRQYLATGDTTGSASIDGPEGTDSLASIEELWFCDGIRTYDPGAPIAQAARLYLATLDRLPDGLGLSFYVDVLGGGTALDAIAGNFVASPEFQAIYGALDDSAFVNQLYLNVLDRPADDAGLAFHTNNLANGFTRGQVVVGFSESPEFTTNNAGLFAAGLWDIDETAGSVARLYLGILDRAADVAGLIFHVDAIKGGQLTLGQDANNFAASPEFQDVYGSLDNSAFVNLLYLNVLERPADEAGLAFHTNNLANGFTRGDVAVGFTESPEYQIKTIGQIDQGIAAVDAIYVP